jgi:putative SOS response-associated peptidase YedK
MCNLYAMMRARAEAAALARAMRDRQSNYPPMPGIFPDYAAPIIVNSVEGVREMRDARWGMPSSKKAIFDNASKRADKLRAKGKEVDFDALLRLEPDGGTTNVRNTASSHWRPWLGHPARCLVPFTSFAEPNDANRSENVWFAFGEDRPLAFFAGLWATEHTSVRKVKEGEVTIDVYSFLTTEPNADVGAIHQRAMPVILTEPDEWDLWMSGAPWTEVQHLQRPLANGRLEIVARGVGVRKDEGLPV